MRIGGFIFFVLGLMTGVACAEPGDQPDFDREVAGIFASRCFDCHNPTEHKGKLDLTRRDAAMKGGKDGAVIVPGKLGESLLWKRVSENEMPPKRPLSEGEKKTLERWVASGAKWGSDPIDPFRFTTSRRAGYDWWSLQPVKRADVPAVKNGKWVRNPIDAFVMAELERQSLAPSPEEDKRTLIRRLTFDLIGLPPTPEQVDAFVKDDSADAYEKLVDRLLASPDYGVRWARHWLDIVRYGESHGFERDTFRPNFWRYRDWVVDAFNSDMDYPKFVRMQLAGDVIEPGSAAGIIATGCLVAGAYDDVGNKQQSKTMLAVVRQDELEDIVGAVSQTFLGLTANCARCHNHKFDPIAQKEYYQLASALSGVRFGERDLPEGDVKPAANEYAAALEARIAGLKARIDGIEAPARKRLVTAEEVAASAGVVPGVSETAITALLTDDQRVRRDQLRYEMQAIRRQQTRAAAAKTFTCVPGRPAVGHLLIRGNPAREGEVVLPAGIASIVGPNADFGLPADAPDSDRRRKLAEWITDSRNPLFARVIVNRLWQYHFGNGIVETPNDFGFNGSAPSHPALLDWLADEMSKQGWSIKRMHRMMVTSATYRQASLQRADAMRIDASNRFLWRMNPRRIEAEALRDTVLFVSGDLNPQLGGPGFEDYYTFTKNSTFYEFRDYIGATFSRRSLYRTWVRSGRNPLLDVFDCPDPSTKTPRRAVTTTPLQALALMNDSFILRMSDLLAERSRRDAGENIESQVKRVYELTLGRTPTHDENAEAAVFVAKNGLPAFCRIVLNCSEFVSVD